MVPLRGSITKSEWSPDDPTAFVPSRPWKLPFITTWDDSRNQNRPTNSAEEAYFFRFRLRGLVQPGWIVSNVCRQRESFSVMDSTVAVQTNGFGSLFHAVRNASMDAFRSSTLRNTPRRIALSSKWPNQRSTRFSQLALVGTKWRP